MIDPFISRMLCGRQLVYKDGSIYVMGTRAILFSLHTVAIIQRMLEQEYGQKGLSIMFNFLGHQTRMAVKMMKNRFGFSGEKAMKMHMGQADATGLGKINFVLMDSKRNHFVLKANSSFAKEYLNTFGIQKEPVDWMFKGGITNLIKEYTGRKDLICIETNCIAQGKKYCEFVVKPKKDFDLKNPKIKKQLPLKFKFNLNKIAEKHVRGTPTRR